jgi:protein-tyrosine sulfotransferase
MAGSTDVPVFILSHPRTGSTLLRCLLDTHPDMCCPGELRLGTVIEFLASAEHYMEACDNEHRPGAGRGPFDATRRVVDGFMSRICAARNKRRWCEKTPLNVYNLAFVHAVYPDARYICLHRHGFDTIRSTIQAGIIDKTMSGRRHTERDVMTLAFERWCDWTEKLLAFEKACADHTLRITYEDLVHDPNACMRRVLAFAHLAPMDDLPIRAFETEHLDGVGDFKFFDTTGITADRVGDGRQLTARDLPAALRARTQGLLDALHY